MPSKIEAVLVSENASNSIHLMSIAALFVIIHLGLMDHIHYGPEFASCTFACVIHHHARLVELSAKAASLLWVCIPRLY